MKITLLLIGKTDDDQIKKGFGMYEKRLIHYISFQTIVIPTFKAAKNNNIEIQKQKEGELILKHIFSSDKLFLLDERGKEFNSVEFAGFAQQQMNSGIKNIVFVVGGPFGFSQEVYKRANLQIALSKMTFSHQMVRLFFIEQLYRAMTIIKNEPYHH